ncbi:MAG: hypothetical protein HKM24_00495, partial [Gammaproteobacteria bacterium]|nr:hypothetical protein [Gammaproteobacteria bacterium]
LDYATLTDVMINSRDPEALKGVWATWRDLGASQRNDFQRYVELTNEAAVEKGYSDAGSLWRSDFAMPSAELDREADHLWDSVQTIYKDLHCHVRAELAEQYDESVIAPDEHLPAHLLGGIWSENWQGVYDRVKPFEAELEQSFDLDKALADEFVLTDLVRESEAFYASIGLPALPASFFAQSMIGKPADRAVDCSAQAWNINDKNDVRISLCGKVSANQFFDINQLLGQNYYSLSYQEQPAVYRKPASPDFAEAVAGVINLSMTPVYFRDIGLINKVDDSNEALVNRQMMLALKIFPSLVHARTVEQWRSDVFAGRIVPARYTTSWWHPKPRHSPAVAPQ